MLQFFTREDFFYNDIPSLGYYGYWEFALQGYSSSGSPFSMFIPYIALALPEDSSFWTATENEGDWTDIDKDVKITTINGPGISMVQYGETGTASLHTSKVGCDDQNYNKICYNTHFSWENIDPDNASAMQYCVKHKQQSNKGDANFIWKAQYPYAIYNIGVVDGVIYRQMRFDYNYFYGRGGIIDLAEIMLPHGVLRIDRCRFGRPYKLTLGHFGLPHIDDEKPIIQKTTVQGLEYMVASISGRQVVFGILNGWSSLNHIEHSGHNAETEKSTVLFSSRECLEYKDTAMELLISLQLHKTDDSNWSDDELYPIKNIRIADYMPSGSIKGAFVELINGKQYTIDFNEIDGKCII